LTTAPNNTTRLETYSQVRNTNTAASALASGFSPLHRTYSPNNETNNVSPVAANTTPGTTSRTDTPASGKT